MEIRVYLQLLTKLVVCLVFQFVLLKVDMVTTMILFIPGSWIVFCHDPTSSICYIKKERI
jgi:hypothetical protein